VAGSKSNSLEEAILNHVLKGLPLSVSNLTLSLYGGAAGLEDDTQPRGEVTGGGYAPQSIAFDPPSAGQTSNTSPLTFPVATADWLSGRLVTHWAVTGNLDAGAGPTPTVLYWGEFSSPKTVSDTETMRVPANSITISEE
jgi:hypothetical protein